MVIISIKNMNLRMAEFQNKKVKSLYLHNLATPYYLRYQKFIDSQEKTILDIGCGNGDKILILAEANPQARIIGIDIATESIKVAEQHCQDRGFSNVDFQVLSIEDLPQLNLEFDYINCDNVLSFSQNIARDLQVMKSVLKPEGIIRANLHSVLQRDYFYRGQKAFEILGLMDRIPQEREAAIAREVITALKDNTHLKLATWDRQKETDLQWYLTNYLQQGDRGYEIPDMFAAIAQAGLEFISMVNWQQWNLLDLFTDLDDLPTFWAMSLPAMSVEEQLQVFELLHPIHASLDFWCGHPQPNQILPVEEWTVADWQGARVSLHPQLKTAQFQADILSSIAQASPVELNQYWPILETSVVIESTTAASLLPLWTEAQGVRSLTQHWLKIKPVDPATLIPIAEPEAFNAIRQILTELERYHCVLLERLP